MDAQHHGHVTGFEDFEHKAEELISLTLSLCEEWLRERTVMPDARASSLAHAAMAMRDAIQTFLALARIR
jgi:hypothetical protein